MQNFQPRSSLAVLLIVGIQLACSAPHIRARRDWYGGQLDLTPEPPNLCFDLLSLEPSIASYCGYNRTLLPNPRGHQTLEEANKEFLDYLPLINSNCSSYLGTLLCAYYFPIFPLDDCKSNQDGNNISTGRPDKILPCKETCIEGKTEECYQKIVEGGTDTSPWTDYLNCKIFLPKDSGLCAYEPNDRVFGSPAKGGEEDKEKGNVGTKELGSAYPEEEPTAEPCDVSKCPKCNHRNKATGKTFKNNGYTYAAEVSVLRKTVLRGHHAYEVDVKQQYAVKTCNDGQIEEAPPMGNHTYLYTNPECCEQCPDLEPWIDSELTTVLVAGYHVEDAELTTKFNLEAAESRSLVSNWVSKYSNKLQSWVKDGNNEREEECGQ